MKLLIQNPMIVNEGRRFNGSVLINNDLIERIFEEDDDVCVEGSYETIDASGLWLLPGVIDDQVHFREPGLTYKADILSESRAAVAGGITSYMEMPNTVPQTTTIELLEEKYALAESKSLANYSFYLGATNTNFRELLKVDSSKVCGVKVFLGSSTGNMLVNDLDVLELIFSQVAALIAVHCEDEATVQANLNYFRSVYGDNLGIEFHSKIRSEEACYKSSSFAVNLANKYNTRLHVLHVSTAKELSLFSNKDKLENKRITAEACVHHLWFSCEDYVKYGNRIKWNPAIKTRDDRDALICAVNNQVIDVVATDHAPHSLEEKRKTGLSAPSGGPLVQHSLPAMLELCNQGRFAVEKIVEKMCHAPATLFGIEKRGYIRPGYYADLVLVNMNEPFTVTPANIYSKCGWSPFEGLTFSSQIVQTYVNGEKVFDRGNIDESVRGRRLSFINR